MPYGIVYKQTNSENGKIYVGQTIRTLGVRWKQHLQESRQEKRPLYNTHFYRALRKYGSEKFVGEVLCECFSQEELDEKEKYFADILNSWSPFGYNHMAGRGRGSTSDELRKRISQKRSKIYYFISPHGDKITVTNLITFCEESFEKLDPPAMRRIIHGDGDSHKGWKRDDEYYTSTLSINKEKKVRTANIVYYFISPQGDPVSIRNMSQFCREHPDRLLRSSMVRVVSGKVKQHHGWTRDDSHYESEEITHHG